LKTKNISVTPSKKNEKDHYLTVHGGAAAATNTTAVVVAVRHQ